MNTNHIKHIAIIGFLSLLITPSILYILNTDNSFNIKKPIEIAKTIKSDFPENYGFKQELLETYLDIKRNTLNDQTLKNRVVKGKNNWLFLGNHYNNTLNNVFGNTKYTKNEISLIKDNLNAWNSYFKKNNIAFYIVIPPNKNKIYKEQLPFKLKQNPTKLSILSKHLKENSLLNFIDLTSSILSAKKQKDVYIKTDTHWNDIGAYYGYNKVIEELVKDKFYIKTEDLGDYIIENDLNYTGDIPRMIKEEATSLNIKTSKIHKSAITTTNEEKLKQYINTNKKLSILVYHDSFMLAMMPYINETFNTSTYIKTYNMTTNEVQKHKPNIVVLEIVERNLDVLLKLKKPLN